MRQFITTVKTRLRTIEWKRWFDAFDNIIALLLAALFSALSRTHAFRQLAVYVWNVLPWLLHHPRLLASGLTALVVMMGFGASYWKRKSQSTYGIAEVAFGTVLAFNLLLSINNTFAGAKMLALGSAVYVIARGFNNISEANGKRVPRAA